MVGYEELLRQVIELETELQLIKAQSKREELADVVKRRMYTLETNLLELKQRIIDEQPAVRVSEMDMAQANVVEQPEFRVRGAAVQPMEPKRGRVKDNRPDRRAPTRKNMEVQFGKTVMSILASVLIIFSIILFGALLYPFLSDGLKVIIMYAVSIAFVAIGLWGRDSKLKTFFTALAGCGVGAFYVSGIISCLVFQIFDILILVVITYLWILAVSWISRERVPVFAVICYVGVVISTGLCMLWFSESVMGLACYLLSIATLYLFNRTKSFQRDKWYFIQFPLVMFALACYYYENAPVVAFIIILCGAMYLLSRFLYKEVTVEYRVSLILTELMMFIGYKNCSQWIFEVDFLLNMAYLFIAGCVAFASYTHFEDKFLKYTPLCCLCVFAPLLNYGGNFEEYVGFGPFAMAILAMGYILNIDILKGVSCGYMFAYLVDYPYSLSTFTFYLICVAFVLEFGYFYATMAYGRHIDALAFMISVGCVLLSMGEEGIVALAFVAYWVAVILSWVFNSRFYATDSFLERLGWGWNALWMSVGTAIVASTPRDDGLKLVVFMLAVLVAYTVNVKWNLECEHPLAGIELCLKGTVFLLMLMSKLNTTGVVLSLLFMLLAVACVTLGFQVRRKSIRLYGLVLAVASVVKCLLMDIEYSSSIYIPVGLFVGGLLCFGISWLYTSLERKLREESVEE